MGLKVKKKRGEGLPPMDGGTYAAVCIGIVDLGEQYSETFKKYSDKALLIWEIPSQTVTVDGEEKPRWLSKQYSASLNEKSNLYKVLVPWRGKPFTEAELSTDGGGFDLLEMLGQGCFLQVIVTEKDDGSKYNDITAVIALPAGFQVPSTATELMTFDMDAWDDEALGKFPEWVQDRVKKSTQYQKLHAPTDPVDFENPAPAAQAEPPKAGGCPI